MTTTTTSAVTSGNAAPRRRAKRDKTDPREYAKFMRRCLRKFSERVADGDVEALADLYSLRAEHDEAMLVAVGRLISDPRYGYSWDQVGNVLGITAQGAQQKYGKKLAARGILPIRKVGAQPGHLR